LTERQTTDRDTLSRDNQNRVASDNQRHIHWWNISEAGSRLSSPKPPSAVA